MEYRECGEVFLDNLLTGPPDAPENNENHDVPDAEDFDDDASYFTTMSVDDALDTDLFGNLETPPDDEDAAEPANQIDQSTPNSENDTEQIAQNPIPAEVGRIELWVEFTRHTWQTFQVFTDKEVGAAETL